MRTDAPRFDITAARRLLDEEFGLADAALSPLPSERDRNYLVEHSGDRYVLKISNAAEPRIELEMQNAALEHVGAALHASAGTRVLANLGGTTITDVTDESGRIHAVRLVTYVPGRTWAEFGDVTAGFRESLGREVARVDMALASFHHSATRRSLPWDVLRLSWTAEHLVAVDDAEVRAELERVLIDFTTTVVPLLDQLPQSVVHNDANQHNVLVEADAVTGARVVGLLDFGDMVHSATVAGLAVAAAYACLECADPLTAIADVVRGYQQVRPLADNEVAVLLTLVRSRLAITVTTAGINAAERPDDPYQQVSAAPARHALRFLGRLAPRLGEYTLRSMCDGKEPVPQAAAVRQWLASNTNTFAPVIEPDPRGSRVTWFDFGVGSTDLGNVTDYNEPDRFELRLALQMAAVGAEVGIGAYGEVRPFYSTDAFRSNGNDGPEWRTLHLGQDLFASAGTPVRAPLAGVVHSIANNELLLDYGPTVVLLHEPAPGVRFHTLYGHLDHSPLNSLRVGDRVERGQVIAGIGARPTNGNWPPHLHLQIIVDMVGCEGDFVGACNPRRWALYRSLCPDPALVTGISNTRPVVAAPPVRDVAERRAARLGRSLSLHYRQPLHIVRGFGQHLYDSDGRRYLDAVNNVAHVGHSHPRVVAAGQSQIAVLNTNTRYLHESVVRYAERIAALFPPGLDVVHLVCSGSEANELALRMARAVTGSRATVVIDRAYHGNTSALVEVSPYKYNGSGGSGPADHVRAVPIPDAANSHLAVQKAIASLADRGYPRPTLLVESWLGSAGQIPLAPGFLHAAYRAVRAAGGVCIADEVQVGFGRLGDSFWGFEQHGVTPDIVTLGKPIGNGHPLAAVVTTAEVADAFANGMEYFNTFGGNHVSCAIGEAVLDVLVDERLQEHALAVGEYLLARLRALGAGHERIGAIRGSGLFAGVELIDGAAGAPDIAAANAVASRMSELGVLVGVDFNTLKIKPPMCFTMSDADQLADALVRAVAGL